MMRKLIFFSILVFATSCSSGKKDLFLITDAFVESLQTSYKSYGLLGGQEHSKITEDRQYQVVPIGRLINIKILKVVSNEVYKELERDLKRHYKNDKRVNDVYINKGGTIMIDCRN